MTPPSMHLPDYGLLRFTCHFCGIELEVSGELGGQTAPCPSCGVPITAPGMPPVPLSEPPGMGEVNRTEWEEVLISQREEGLSASEMLGRSDPPLVPAGLERPAQQGLAPRGRTLPGNMEPKGRRAFYPVTVTLLSAAIVGLGGMLLWRSELWRPGLEEDRAVSAQNFAGPKTERSGISQGVRERAEAEMRALAEAAAPVWPATPGVEEEQQAATAMPEEQPALVAMPQSGATGSTKPVETPEAGETNPGAKEAVASVEPPRTEAPAPKGEAEMGKENAVLPPPSPERASAAGGAAQVASVDSEPEASKAGPSPVESTQPSVAVENEVVAMAAPQASEVIPVAVTKPEPAPAVVMPSEPGPEKSEDVAADSGSAQDRAREAVRRFLEADRWQERIPFIFSGESKQTAIRDYFQAHPDRPVKDYRLEFFHSEAGKEGAPAIFVFFLTMEHEEDGYPVIVKSDAKGESFGVDWDLHVEFKDRQFAEFVEKKETGAREFRVVIQRVTYWEEDRDQIPGIEELVCYKVDPPYPGFTQFAFVEKGSEEGKRMISGLSWETDPLAAKVRMNWAKFPSGRPYLRVTDLVARSWAE